MAKILITGGAGFIGSEFVRKSVEKGYSTVVIDKLTYAGDLRRIDKVLDKIKFYRVDTADQVKILEIFKLERPDFVVHFAAESHVDRSILDPFSFIESNIKGTLSLLNAAREVGIKLFVNISTDEVYGELGHEGYFTENSPLNPNSPYSVSKAAQDMLGRSYFRTYGLPVVTVRPSNNYGPWQYPEKLIPVVIYKAINGEPIPVYGKGENVREWLFVTDCVEGIFTIMEKGKPGEVYNLGSGFEKRNIDVVKEICRILDKEFPENRPHENLIIFVKDRPGHDFRYGLDSSKIKEELGFYAKTTFEEGIELTVRWYIENLNWLYDKVKDLREFWAKNYKY
ncbi:MAG: dTDP-glucose 4,6-dehydratase [Candidatus Hydrothermia bacterium]